MLPDIPTQTEPESAFRQDLIVQRDLRNARPSALLTAACHAAAIAEEPASEAASDGASCSHEQKWSFYMRMHDGMPERPADLDPQGWLLAEDGEAHGQNSVCNPWCFAIPDKVDFNNEDTVAEHESFATPPIGLREEFFSTSVSEEGWVAKPHLDQGEAAIFHSISNALMDSRCADDATDCKINDAVADFIYGKSMGKESCMLRAQVLIAADSVGQPVGNQGNRRDGQTKIAVGGGFRTDVVLPLLATKNDDVLGDSIPFKTIEREVCMPSIHDTYSCASAIVVGGEFRTDIVVPLLAMKAETVVASDCELGYSTPSHTDGPAKSSHMSFESD